MIDSRIEKEIKMMVVVIKLNGEEREKIEVGNS